MTFSGVLSPCIACHNQGDYMKKFKLLRMEQLCSALEENHDVRHSPDLGLYVHSNCRYGLSCSTLTDFDNECNAVARRIASRVITAAVMEDESIYHQILELCRGDFPMAYNYIENIHFQYKKSH